MDRAEAIAALTDLMAGLDPDQDAGDYNDQLAKRMERAGWWYFREVTVASRGTPDGYRGRLDFVVWAPIAAGIEVDHCSPRAKSLHKLMQLTDIDGIRVVIVRTPEGNLPHQHGEVILISGREGQGGV